MYKFIPGTYKKMNYIIYQKLNQSNVEEFKIYCKHPIESNAIRIFEILLKIHPEFKLHLLRNVK